MEVPVDSKQWMKAIEGNKRVSELTIPGTHDSATGNSTVVSITGLLKTQRLKLSEQLHIGARFLDIRAKLYYNDLILVHGILDLKMSLSAAILCCKEFLQENPSEFVFFSLKKEGEDTESSISFEKALRNELNKEISIWFLDKYIPTLDEVRGRLLLLRRFPIDVDTTHLGIDTQFKDDAIFEYKFNSDPAQYLYCEDKYVVKGGSYKELTMEKMAYVRENVYKIATKHRDADILFITFLSCIQSINTPLNLAREINPTFLLEYSTVTTKLMGIFPCDYIETEFAQLLISNNY